MAPLSPAPRYPTHLRRAPRPHAHERAHARVHLPASTCPPPHPALPLGHTTTLTHTIKDVGEEKQGSATSLWPVPLALCCIGVALDLSRSVSATCS